MNASITTAIMAIALSFVWPATTQATLMFDAGTTVASQVTPNINNLIDLNLSDYADNSVNTLIGYTTTQGDTISGTVTRSNLVAGSLLSRSDFDTAIAYNQSANQLSGVVNFSNSSGVNDSNSFVGTNSTGSLTLNSTISLASAFQTRTFFADVNNPGTGSANSAPISGNGFLNINSLTLSLSQPVKAVGFTQLQRDGTRTYSWSVEIIDLDTLATQVVQLGRISTAGLRASAHPGDVNAGNYAYDIFVGYAAPEGSAVSKVNLGGGFMNVDGLAYVAVVPEPGSIALMLLGTGAMLLARRRSP